jgi:hypothetical protein
MSAVRWGKLLGNNFVRGRWIVLMMLLSGFLVDCGGARLPDDTEAVKMSQLVFGASGDARCGDEKLVRVKRSESYVETFWECEADSEILEVIVVVNRGGVVEILRTNKEK